MPLPIPYYRPSEKVPEKRKPSFIAKQLKEELHRAFEEEESQISLSKLTLHPIKTTKFIAKQWAVSGLQKELSGQFQYEFIWKDILSRPAHDYKGNLIFDPLTGKPLTSGERILWRDKKTGEAITVGKKIEEYLTTGQPGALQGIRKSEIDKEVWNALRRQKLWGEMASFGRSPRKFLWRRLFGKKLVEEKGVLKYTPAPLYKITPKAFLRPEVQKVLEKKGVAEALVKARVAVKKPIKEAAKKVAQPAARVAKKVASKVAQTAVAKAGGAAGAAVGSAAPVVGTAIGWIAGEVIVKAGGKLFKWAWDLFKLVFLSCCSIYLILFLLVVGGIGSAFYKFGERGAGAGAIEPSLVQVGNPSASVNGTVSSDPSQIEIPKDGGEHEVTITTCYTNTAKSTATDVSLIVDFNGADGVVDPGGGTVAGNTIIWDLADLAPGEKGCVTYKLKIIANEDKIIPITATVIATVDGKPSSSSWTSYIGVGEVTFGNTKLADIANKLANCLVKVGGHFKDYDPSCLSSYNLTCAETYWSSQKGDLQCVAFVQGAMSCSGITPLSGHAYQWYGNAASNPNFDTYPDGSIRPLPGDILALSGGPTGYGHVAVIVEVSLDGEGSGHVTIVHARMKSRRVALAVYKNKIDLSSLEEGGYLIQGLIRYKGGVK